VLILSYELLQNKLQIDNALRKGLCRIKLLLVIELGVYINLYPPII